MAERLFFLKVVCRPGNKMAEFYKGENCPTSQDLLDFSTGDMSLVNGKTVREHLAGCEFCAAEADFYGRYPQVEEKVEPVEMPKPLYELAQDLLVRKRGEISLEELVKEVINDPKKHS